MIECLLSSAWQKGKRGQGKIKNFLLLLMGGPQKDSKEKKSFRQGGPSRKGLA